MWNMLIFVTYSLLFINSINGLESYTGNDIPSAGWECFEKLVDDGSCPTFECGQNDDCQITCEGHGDCNFVILKVYNNHITINSNSNGALVGARITAYDTASFTFSGCLLN